MTENNNGKIIITGIGILSVAILEGFALNAGINGTYFAAALSAIGVMVGYVWGKSASTDKTTSNP